MLTTKKFIREVQELGLKTSESSNIISIYYRGRQVSYVYTKVLFSVSTAYAAFDDLPE